MEIEGVSSGNHHHHHHEVGISGGGDDEGSILMYLVWEVLTVVLPNFGNGPTKRLINGLTGYTQPGRIMAIMGHSGSGKSTLLDAFVDLGEGYFVARFQMKEDMDFVLTNGPWVIANQYLVIQRIGFDSIQSIPIWVRLSKLSMEWLNSDFMWSIGGMLGRMCKVDPITKNQARELLRWNMSLGLVCLKCGRYSHSKDMCREGVMDVIVEDEANTNATAAEGDTAEIIPGNNFQPKNNKDKKNVSGKIPKASSASGSRFDILNEEVEVMVVEGGSQAQIKYFDGKDTGELKPVLHNDSSFDTVASKLEEAMALVFE
ncbi:hypothetical protein Ddye_022950 [Dipteronia dyeriana]|uniref:ABC transporter domain-containing protein n=1 Tax=Dipteronia dyeriana TaxID=168575 RepID=A0AAD9TSH7_9ROSI|nr:hypothetical protein Ddye_022950 [Dipteronia dyeriana]